MTARAKVAVPFDHAEIARRREAVEQARANLALEGIELTPEASADMERYINGQADIEDLVTRVIKRHGL